VVAHRFSPAATPPCIVPGRRLAGNRGQRHKTPCSGPDPRARFFLARASHPRTSIPVKRVAAYPAPPPARFFPPCTAFAGPGPGPPPPRPGPPPPAGAVSQGCNRPACPALSLRIRGRMNPGWCYPPYLPLALAGSSKFPSLCPLSFSHFYLHSAPFFSPPVSLSHFPSPPFPAPGVALPRLPSGEESPPPPPVPAPSAFPPERIPCRTPRSQSPALFGPGSPPC